MAKKMERAPDQAWMDDKDHKATAGIHLTDTLFLRTKDGDDTYVPDHVSIRDVVKMMCCPACCLKVPLTSNNKHKILFQKGCGICSCPLEVKYEDELVGRIQAPHCCENGVWFCCCPWLNCTGHVKIMGVEHTPDGTTGSLREDFVLAKELYACWPCVGCVATFCVPCGVCWNMCCGCKNYIEGTEARTIKQPVYKGPWRRSDGSEKLEKIGQIVTTERFFPVSCCCAAPTKMAYGFQPLKDKAKGLSQEELATMSLVLATYKGLPHPLRCLGSSSGIQQPWGVWCLDCGMGVETEWMKISDAMGRHM